MNTPESAAPIVNVASADGARLTVHARGAHVVSWIPADGRERLYRSGRVGDRPAAAIRGGIPVIFPQFADEGGLPKHGFARTARWQLIDPPRITGGESTVRLRLDDDEASRAIWPAAFSAELTLRLAGAQLSARLAIVNRDARAWSFTAALHSYLAVTSIAEVRLEGLRGSRFQDRAAGGALRCEDAEALAVAGEIDRLYLDTPPCLRLHDPAGMMTLEQSGFPDTVVWNPGAAKAALLADLDPGGEQRFLCVEAAAVGRPVRLAPGERWVGTQRLIAG